MVSMASLARLVALVAIVLWVAACDRGGAFIAENKTDQELVARVTGTERVEASSTSAFRPREDLFVLPAQSRLAIEVLGFTDPFMVQKIEILTSDCATIGTFDQASGVAFARDGQVIVIDPGPTAGLRREFPETGTLAATTDRCGTVSSP